MFWALGVGIDWNWAPGLIVVFSNGVRLLQSGVSFMGWGLLLCELGTDIWIIVRDGAGVIKWL